MEKVHWTAWSLYQNTLDLQEKKEQITFYCPLLLLWSAENTKITVVNRAAFQKY